ncbi:hypothetical protein MITSMUL_04828 [Mitsuokella multacida DSM 20544]|uniref:Uncharacterized protein n=1 Tax=Mitsuokella multacida DSM 20544 TaxID=500635 RepID=C9KN16_9FIRM|nr:hypothetical protein MITSMUL_04828 [Mitsuokella multacida DSM 20544]
MTIIFRRKSLRFILLHAPCNFIILLETSENQQEVESKSHENPYVFRFDFIVLSTKIYYNKRKQIKLQCIGHIRHIQ